ncbi:MAG: YkgJ family cysteine cluster protein [Chthoniobacteraceae bacterium]|nr:YkgJ family cysteine cluster protein [Chthoniobacteraceae bacterium]
MVSEKLDPGKQAAARLCASCGMCCNGVLFHGVRLQAADSARELAALGLKVKRRKNERHVLQPCPAHQGSQCAIYSRRPERCRVFECRLLKAMDSGETTEAAALEKTQQARRRVARVRELFHRAGETRENKAFITRYETLLTEPLDPSPAAASLRTELKAAMQDLEDLLKKDFRVEPALFPFCSVEISFPQK